MSSTHYPITMSNDPHTHIQLIPAGRGRYHARLEGETLCTSVSPSSPLPAS
jgi:hypothetical protein